MSEAKHIDLKVDGGDFLVDAAGFSESISDRESIGQDIKHRIVESGLLFLLVGERSDIKRQRVYNQIKMEVEKDERLKPGTVRIINIGNQPGTFYITAVTFDYAALTVYL